MSTYFSPSGKLLTHPAPCPWLPGPASKPFPHHAKPFPQSCTPTTCQTVPALFAHSRTRRSLTQSPEARVRAPDVTDSCRQLSSWRHFLPCASSASVPRARIAKTLATSYGVTSLIDNACHVTSGHIIGAQRSPCHKGSLDRSTTLVTSCGVT